MAHILSLEGHRVPPTAFVKRLEAFDPNLRVVWGINQAVPFPGWVIERKIPGHMKEKVYGGDKKEPNRERFADQYVVDEKNKTVARRRYDMMPDWHPVYRVMDEWGDPITELGDFVIDYLRRHYMRTLLGFPELSARHHAQDLAEQAIREEKQHDQFLDEVSRKVMDHKYSIWSEVMAFGGQATTIKEGTDFNGTDDDGDGEGTSGQDAGAPKPH